MHVLLFLMTLCVQWFLLSVVEDRPIRKRGELHAIAT